MIQQRKNQYSLTKADSKKNDPGGSQMRVQYFYLHYSYSALRKDLQAYVALQKHEYKGSEPPRKMLLNAISLFEKTRITKRWVQRSKIAISFWCAAASCA